MEKINRQLESFGQTEQYIIDESQEITYGAHKGWLVKLRTAFPAFKHKNYQLYFLGQLVSLIGTWLQIVAQGWLVLRLTQSALWVGIIFAVNSLPVLFFVLFGGVIVDRFSKTKIIILTQSFSMMLALVQGIITITGVVNVYYIAILTFLLGIVNALDMPARQAYMSEIVDKSDLSSAIALNSGMFNAARVIGPMIAGALIVAIGEGGAFIANGLSFIAPIITLFYIKPKELLAKIHPHPIQAIREGLSYSFTHSTIRTLMIFAAINSIFGWSYITILPVVAKKTFNMNADGLSILYAASGLGAILGTILVSGFSHKIKPMWYLIGGIILFGCSMLLFAFNNNLLIGLLLLFLSGLGLVMHFSILNTTIQHLSPPHMMGRILSVYTFMFLGLSPLGSLQVGFIAERFGAPSSLAVNAIAILLFATFQFFCNKKLRTI